MKKMHFRAVELEYLDEGTIRRIRDWRNQEFVRMEMFTQNIIGEEEHLNWINSIRNDKDRHLFVYYLDDEPFAVVQSRYYPEHEYVETGDYLISEDYQSMGYGSFIKYFTSEIMYHYLGYTVIYGEILDINRRNLRIANKLCDRVRKAENKREIDGVLHDVYLTEISQKSWDEGSRNKLGTLVFKFVEQDYDIIM